MRNHAVQFTSDLKRVVDRRWVLSIFPINCAAVKLVSGGKRAAIGARRGTGVFVKSRDGAFLGPKVEEKGRDKASIEWRIISFVTDEGKLVECVARTKVFSR